MSEPLKPLTYGTKIGDTWVEIDYTAQAVSVSKDRRPGCVARTEDIGNGFLIDYGADGRVIGVEVIAAGADGEHAG